MILIVAESFPDYVRFMRQEFPNFPLSCKEYQYLIIQTEQDEEICYSIQIGTPYILVSGRVSDWFKNRFTKLKFDR